MGIESKLTQFPSPWLSQSTNLQAHRPQSLKELVQNEPIPALGPEHSSVNPPKGIGQN
jgi:hypothetical protein